MLLHVYISCKHICALYCISFHVILYLNASIYADICVYRCILACICSYPTSLFPPVSRITHDSKRATQNCQMQVQYWLDITELSGSVAS